MWPPLLVLAGAALLGAAAQQLLVGAGAGGRLLQVFLAEQCAGGGGAFGEPPDLLGLQKAAEEFLAPDRRYTLRVMSREAVCEPMWGGLPALVGAAAAAETAALLGSPPPLLCDTVARLAALGRRPFVSWTCPQVPQNELSSQQGFVSIVPPLSASAEGVANIAKLFRWKSAAIISADGSWWKTLAHATDVAMRVQGLHVRHHIVLRDNFLPQQLKPIAASPPKSGAFNLLVVLSMDVSLAVETLQVLDKLGAARLPVSAALLLSPTAPSLPSVQELSLVNAWSLLLLAPNVSDADLATNSTEALWQRLRTALTLLLKPTNSSGPAPLVLLDWWESRWRPLMRIGPSGTPEAVFVGAADWPRFKLNLSSSSGVKPVATVCEDEDCGGAPITTAEEVGLHMLRGAHIAALAVCSAVVLAALAVVVAIARKQLLKKRMSKGPYKILLTPSDFVFPHVADSLRVDEGIEAMLCCWLQQLHEFGGPEVTDRPDLLKGSMGSLQHLRPTGVGSTGSLTQARSLLGDPKARYNGDLVQLKELPAQGTFELKSKAMDVLMTLHGLRHENLNPLIGCLTDSLRPALVLEWCSRGSLEDVLVQDEIKLDWSFRLSLLTDLVRGMRYLHSSPARVHGYLTSRNCVIDARWVLKITDYGLPAFYEAQNISPPCKTARDLLWTAPELLRSAALRKQGTQPGDVYSFGIIMQEVVVRGEPFCMLALSPEEILEKVKRPPPLIRPSVSKGAAPPEAINIMRQCWAEQPDMRPDFGSVHDLFKKLNHGRKVNFVDTMFQMLEKYSNNLEELIRERTEQLDMEKKKTEQLLNRMLPSSVADKLKLGMPVDPEDFLEVTIYFSDIVGFTTISAYSTPFQVVDLLNDLYTCFDATINAYNVYKVETIGDAYMVVGGLPVRIQDHADQVATMALDLLHQSGRFRIRHLPGTPLRLRIGLHTGPCCAGVVGLTMPRYCLFGDTVNTASRMESTGSAWRIHLSQATKEKLDAVGGYQLEYRGETELKGKGKMPTYWLLGKAGFNKELPVPPPLGLDERLIRASRYGASGGGSSVGSDRPQARSEDGGGGGSSSGATSPIPSKSVSTCDLKVRAAVHAADHVVKSASAEQQMAVGGGGLASSEAAAALLGVSATSLNCRGGRRDLSAAYNHYRCLSPSEQTLNHHHARSGARFLRRQFSLDRGDDPPPHAGAGMGLDGSHTRAASTGRLCKQNSAGAAPDLERIEEIPLSASSKCRLPAFSSVSVSAESLN